MESTSTIDYMYKNMYSICTINRFTCQKKWAGADPKYRLRLQIKFKIGCCSGSSYKSYKKNSAPTRSGSETLFSIINDFLCVLLADWWIVRSSPRIPNVSTTGLGKKKLFISLWDYEPCDIKKIAVFRIQICTDPHKKCLLDPYPDPGGKKA